MNPNQIPQPADESAVEKPKELWQVAIDKIVEIKSQAATKAAAEFKDLKQEDWEPAAIEFLTGNRPLCNALYKKYWWGYAEAETANGRKLSVIRTAEEPSDCPRDELYPLVNMAVLKRGNNTAFINQILDEYEEAHPTPNK